MAERELRAEVGDAQSASARRGVPLTSSRNTARTASSVSGPGLLATACCSDFRFALRIEDGLRVGLFQLADLLGDLGPAIDRGEDLAVDGVELAAQVGERRRAATSLPTAFVGAGDFLRLAIAIRLRGSCRLRR